MYLKDLKQLNLKNYSAATEEIIDLLIDLTDSLQFSKRLSFNDTFSLATVEATCEESENGSHKKYLVVQFRPNPSWNENRSQTASLKIRIENNQQLDAYNQIKKLKSNVLIPIVITDRKPEISFYITNLEDMLKANNLEYGLEVYLVSWLTGRNLRTDETSLTNNLSKYLTAKQKSHNEPNSLIFENIDELKTISEIFKNNQHRGIFNVLKEVINLIDYDIKTILRLNGLAETEDLNLSVFTATNSQQQITPNIFRHHQTPKEYSYIGSLYDDIYGLYREKLKQKSLVYRYILNPEFQKDINKLSFGELVKSITPIAIFASFAFNCFWLFFIFNFDIDLILFAVGSINFSYGSIPIFLFLLPTVFVLSVFLVGFTTIYFNRSIIKLLARKICKNIKYRHLSEIILLILTTVAGVVLLLIWFQNEKLWLYFLSLIMMATPLIEPLSYSIKDLNRHPFFLRLLIVLFLAVPTVAPIFTFNNSPGKYCSFVRVNNNEEILHYEYYVAGNWSDSADVLFLPGSSEKLPDGSELIVPSITNVRKTNFPAGTLCPDGIDYKNVKYEDIKDLGILTNMNF